MCPRPSLEEGRPLQTADAALNFIGARGAMTERTSRLSRVQYAEEVLQKDVLPHVGLEVRRVLLLWACVCLAGTTVASMTVWVSGVTTVVCRLVAADGDV